MSKLVTAPNDVNKELYGLAFKWWVKRVKPAKNTLYSRVSVYNQHIFPNFNENMSFKQFCMEQEKMQSIIDNATEGISKNIHIYLKMIFDWAVEHGELTISQHPILNKKVKRKTFTSAEEQAKLGYMKEPIRLYYPLSSLNHFFGGDVSADEMQEKLSKFKSFAYDKFGNTLAGYSFTSFLPAKRSEFFNAVHPNIVQILTQGV